MAHIISFVLGYIPRTDIAGTFLNFVFVPKVSMTEEKIYEMFSFFSFEAIIKESLGMFFGLGRNFFPDEICRLHILSFSSMPTELPIMLSDTQKGNINSILRNTEFTFPLIKQLIRDINAINLGEVSVYEIKKMLTPYGIWSPTIDYPSITMAHVGEYDL